MPEDEISMRERKRKENWQTSEEAPVWEELVKKRGGDSRRAKRKCFNMVVKNIECSREIKEDEDLGKAIGLNYIAGDSPEAMWIEW